MTTADRSEYFGEGTSGIDSKAKLNMPEHLYSLAPTRTDNYSQPHPELIAFRSGDVGSARNSASPVFALADDDALSSFPDHKTQRRETFFLCFPIMRQSEPPLSFLAPSRLLCVKSCVYWPTTI